MTTIGTLDAIRGSTAKLNPRIQLSNPRRVHEWLDLCISGFPITSGFWGAKGPLMRGEKIPGGQDLILPYSIQSPQFCHFRVLHMLSFSALKRRKTDFPGGPVVKNLPCNAQDVGSIPGWGSKILHAPGQGSPRTIRSNKRAHVLQVRLYTVK